MSTETLTILRYEALGSVTGLGQSIVRMVVGTIMHPWYTMLIGLNPRTDPATILWATRILPGGVAESLDLATLPYTVTDLAETLCREKFPAMSSGRRLH